MPDAPKLDTRPLYAWEIVRLIPHQTDDKKKVRSVMMIAARDINEVWEYLAIDRADAAVEIESIARFGPIISVLDANVAKPTP